MDGAMTGYSRFSAPVRGGLLSGGVWEPEGTPLATVIAVHGITSSHLAWALLPAALPGVRVIAPDLRGRAASRNLPGPWGMAQHADDVAAVLEHFGLASSTVLAHSMGAFVAVTLAGRHPELVDSLVLVDGGLPLPAPGASAEGTLSDGASVSAAILGPAAARLSMEFSSTDAYRRFWRQHPAFARDWSPMLEAYLDYDLVGAAPQLRPSSVIEAVWTDALELSNDTDYLRLFESIPGPVRFLRAPRGLLDDVPALYPPETLAAWRNRLPQLDAREVADVNHYTILFSPRGIAVVAAATEEAIGAGVVRGR